MFNRMRIWCMFADAVQTETYPTAFQPQMGSPIIPENTSPMRKYTETLSGIIESSGLNLNQISKVSGISNAYLTKLVKGPYQQTGKG
jgi:hypothetical protein